jgi:nicotinate-nucleotide pyrophosphorylase (carboxylating)
MENDMNFNMLLEMALKEDLGDSGDITSDAIFTDEIYSYNVVAKERGIICGIDIFIAVMKHVDSTIYIENHFIDGDYIGKGNIVADVSGPVKSILLAERTALNFLSHLSGIATRTAAFVRKTGGRAVILDTRKTIPGYRELQKYAVRCGGGENHRMGLYDMVMIKDNHIDASGGITGAVRKIRAKWGDRYKIEVETRNLEEVKEALECAVDRIMLDNMNDDEIKSAVELISRRAETEASGNMDLHRVKDVSLTGVDYISIGELTKSVRVMDFSLKKVNK